MSHDDPAPIDVTGTWLQTNRPVLGPGTVQIRSEWRFHPDGTAQLEARASVMNAGAEVTQAEETHIGRYRIDGSAVIIEVPGHSDSPFRLTVTSPDELKLRGAVFHRVS